MLKNAPASVWQALLLAPSLLLVDAKQACQVLKAAPQVVKCVAQLPPKHQSSKPTSASAKPSSASQQPFAQASPYKHKNKSLSSPAKLTSGKPWYPSGLAVPEAGPVLFTQVFLLPLFQKGHERTLMGYDLLSPWLDLSVKRRPLVSRSCLPQPPLVLDLLTSTLSASSLL